MSLQSDLLIDRQKLKRRLSIWQAVAILLLVVAGFALAGGGATSTASLARRHVARLTVAGTISEDDDRIRAVEALAKNNSVAALIVAIDSPGGTVGGGESLHAAIKKVAAAKPVVTVMRGTAASAGYMIAVPAARIFARGSTLTGSIGVILQTPETSGLLEKLGVHFDVIASGPLKDQPNPFHPLSDEGRTVLRGLIADLYDQFVGMVAAGRHMQPDAVRALADGRAFTGRQALERGLVDEIGGEAEARAWLASAKQVPADLPIVELDTEPHRGPLARLAGSFGGALGDAALPFAEGLVKSVAAQRLTVDGAWALWQGPSAGDASAGGVAR